MPFQSARSPSLQLGLLRAISESHGFPTTTFHFTLEFASRLEPSVYEKLCQMRGRLIGDWLFSREAFRSDAPDQEARLIADFPAEVAAQFGEVFEGGSSSPGATRRSRTLQRIRNEVVPAFLNSMMAQTDWSKFKVIGFSSVFQQTAASIALARRIKEAFPHIITVFGGSNFEDEMGLELVEKVPWIDYAIIGEGDVSFPELLVALSEDKSTADIPGVATRSGGRIVFGGDRPLLQDMDQLPTARFDEYFSRAEALGILPKSRQRATRVPFESSRGCWWGAKHHCTFCGLNANGMPFRSKTPDAVVRELADLAKSSGSFSFYAVDNIVDATYLQKLFSQIESSGADYKFFYEVKANLTRDQIRRLAGGGVVEIQPGIESLSTHVLDLMRKGTSAAQNVNTLRWAMYYGIAVGWNVLWGFPGETEEDYAKQAALVANLTHLAPPSMPGVRIVMERFSPIFTDREKFPVEFMRPEPSVSYVYPASVDASRVAYMFEYRLRDSHPDAMYAPLGARLREWIEAWGSAAPHAGRRNDGTTPAPSWVPTLTLFHSDDFIKIVDNRRREGRTLGFEGPAARLYKAAMDRPVRVETAVEEAGLSGSDVNARELLERFCADGLMMCDGDKYLALALPATPGR